jgi:hypothetical protein
LWLFFCSILVSKRLSITAAHVWSFTHEDTSHYRIYMISTISRADMVLIAAPKTSRLAIVIVVIVVIAITEGHAAGDAVSRR